MKARTKVATAALAALAIGVPTALSTSSAGAAHDDQIKHVLLISVDGMHQSDLAWYVANNPELGARAAGHRRRRVHRRAHRRSVGLRSGGYGADDRR